MKMHPFFKAKSNYLLSFHLVWVYDLDMFLNRFCEIHSHQSQAGNWEQMDSSLFSHLYHQLNVLDSMQGEAWLKWGVLIFLMAVFDAVTCHLFYTAAVRAWWPWEPGEESAHSWCHSPAPVPAYSFTQNRGRERRKRATAPHYDP